MRFRTKLRVGTTLALMGAASAFAAQAQAQESASSDDLGEITVTARRQAESLQDTPLTITAITGDKLETAGARNLQDISFLTPGLVLTPLSGEAGSSPVIRGLVSLGGTSDPTVAVFFDGAFLGGTAANSIALLDLERVEVVKGPVNSLYGRAAYAGAINYISRTPDGEFDVRGSATVGNDGQRKISAVVGGWLVPDLLAVRVAGGYDAYNGGYTDPVNGLRAGDYEKRDGQISINFTPAPNFSMVGRIYYGHDTFGPGALGYADGNCGGTNTYAGVTMSNFYCGKYDEDQNPVEVAPEGVRFTANDRKVFNGFLRTTFEASAFDVTALTAYSNIKSDRFTDFFGYRDGIAFDLVSTGDLTGPVIGRQSLYMNFGADADTEDFSQEIRFSAKADERWRWSFGGYYAKVDNYDSTIIGLDSNKLAPGTTIRGAAGTVGYAFDRVFLTPGGGRSNAVTAATLESTLWSAFAGSDFDITDQLTVTGEARYSSDKRVLDSLYSNLLAFYPGLRPFGGPFERTFKNWTGRLSAQYKFTPDIMLYATFADGFKAGGFNTRATIDEDRPYEPEKNDTYEIGLKSSLFDNMLNLNVNLFYIELTGLQYSGPAADPNNAGFVTKNIGAAESKGFEIEVQARPVTGLRLNGGLTYTDSKIKDGTYDFSLASGCTQVGADFCDPSRIVKVVTPAAPNGVLAVDLGGLQVPRQPKWTVTAEVEYTHALTDSVDWFARAQYRFQSKIFPEPNNFWWYGPLNRVNLRAGISWDQWTLTGFVDNVFDENTPDSAYRSTILNNFANVYDAAMPMPRRYGMTLSFAY